MICPICHKKVNRINSCRIIVTSGTAKSKSKRTCKNCAKHLFKLILDGLLDKSFIAHYNQNIGNSLIKL